MFGRKRVDSVGWRLLACLRPRVTCSSKKAMGLLHASSAAGLWVPPRSLKQECFVPS